MQLSFQKVTKMDTYGNEIPEIQDFLHRHHVTSHGRRKTVHVTERGRTAIGLIRVPAVSPVRKTLITKGVSLTPSPTINVSFHYEKVGQSTHPLDRRASTDFKHHRLITPNPLIKSKSDSLGSKHGLLIPKQTLHVPFSQRRGSVQLKSVSQKQARRKSRAFSVPDDDEEELRKVTLHSIVTSKV